MPDNFPNRPFKGLKRYKQLTGYNCGPATLQILLSHFGVETHQEQMIDAAGVRSSIEKQGMSVRQLAKVIGTLYPYMSFWTKRDSTVSDLVAMVREYNYPVGVNWQGIFEYEHVQEYPGESEDEHETGLSGQEGHYSVLVDLDTMSNYVQLVDPYGHYAGRDRFIKIQEFLTRWWDDNYETDPLTGGHKYVYESRLMFTILPKSITFPEELGMVRE